MFKIFLISTATIIFLVFTKSSYASKDEISKCHEFIKPLHQKRERVAELDGIWGLFEKNRDLQGNSVIAINLDRKVNSIIFHLEYLCNTLNGIPMNEVARYVRDGIYKKGKEGFRKELIILGKNESEINIKTKKPEFLDWKWIDFNDLPKIAVNFKLDVYKNVKHEVKKILN